MADPGDNVAIVRRVFETGRGYLRGERGPFEDAVKELVSDDVVFVPSSALPAGTTGPFRGREGFVSIYTTVASLWSSFEITAKEFVDVPPNNVVVISRVVADRGGGVGYAAEVGTVWRVEDGRVVSVHSYENKRRALEEAGVEDLPARDRSD